MVDIVLDAAVRETTALYTFTVVDQPYPPVHFGYPFHRDLRGD